MSSLSEPLDAKSIRLLRLQPAKDPNSHLEATLEISVFPPKDAYEALSYVWGTSAAHHDLYVSGKPLKVKENLHAALVQLRKSDQERILWIDAICINQADNVEKSKQVAIMGDIYRLADTVLVWLGSATADSGHALEYLGSLADLPHHLKMKSASRFPDLMIPDIYTTVGLDSKQILAKANSILSDARIAGITTVLGSKWFTRAWIVQEYILAKKIQVMFGNQVLAEEQFRTGMEFIMGVLKATGIKEGFEDVNHAWTLLAHRAQHQSVTLPGVFMTEAVSFFEQVLSDFADQECGDDRDRVFAFLALDTSEQKMKPDYTRTTAEVYTEFAARRPNYLTLFKAGLCRRGPLSIAQHPTALGRDYLPSWCPDFRPVGQSWSPMFTNIFATSAADYGRMGRSRTRTNMAVLTANGLDFDCVKVIKPRNTDSAFAPTSNPSSFFAMIDHLRDIQAKIAHDFIYPNMEFVETALGVTLSCGIPALSTDLPSHPLRFLVKDFAKCRSLFTGLWIQYMKICMDSSGSIYKRIADMRDETVTIPDDFADDMPGEEQLAWIYHKYLAKMIRTHDFFRTTNGYFGLGPPGIRVGDPISVLSGHRTPFIIRKAPIPPVPAEECCGLPHAREEGDTVEYFHILGPCYVHGIMNSELYQDPVWKTRFAWTTMEMYNGMHIPIPAGLGHFI